MSVAVETGFGLRHSSVAICELTCPVSLQKAVTNLRFDISYSLSTFTTVRDSVCSAIAADRDFSSGD